MKNFIFISILFSSSSLGLTFMGPPVAELNDGQYSIGFDFTNDNEELEYRDFGITVKDDINIDVFLSDFGFKFSENTDMHLKFGLNNIDEASTGFAWGVTTKNTVSQDEQMKLGLIIQTAGIYNKESFAYISPYYVIGFEDSIDVYEIQAGFGPCLDYDVASVYAYPFFHYIYGEDSFGIDIRNTEYFGGCVGIVLKPDNNININIEGQFTGDSYSLGLGFNFKFGKNSPNTLESKNQSNSKIPSSNKPDTNKKIKGYKATTDPRTGNVVTQPIYEDN